MKNDINNTAIKDEMIQHMKDKYNEDFEFLNMNTEVWTADYTEMLLSSPSFPEKTIIVHRNKKSAEITDNYLAIKLNPDIEQKISEIVYEIYGDNITFNCPKSIPLPSYMLANFTAEDYLRAKPKITDATIFVAKDLADKETDLELFRRALQERGYYLTFSIVYVEKSLMDSINEANYVEYANESRNGVLAYGEFIIDTSHEFSYKKWR